MYKSVEVINVSRASIPIPFYVNAINLSLFLALIFLRFEEEKKQRNFGDHVGRCVYTQTILWFATKY